MLNNRQFRHRAAGAACLVALASAGLTVTSAPASSAPAGLTVDDVTVPEPATGTATATFTVRLREPAGQHLTFGWTTGSGSAGADDFAARSGVGKIAAGQTRTTVAVPVAADRLDEYDETFYVTLFDPVHTTVSDGVGVGTIVDDDVAPSLSVPDLAVTESGDRGTTSARFTVATSAPSGRSITVSYTTVDGSLVAPGDYGARAGTLTLAPGLTRATVAVPVVNDDVGEATGTMTLRIAKPVNATIADATGDLAFADDDGGPPSATGLVITEIDYDQPGTDRAEFVEIHNPGRVAVALDSLSLVFHNGFDDKIYRTVPLTGTIAPGGFAVVASPGVDVDSRATVVRMPSSTSWIQNGAPDAVSLVQGARVLDSVAYEGGMTVAGEGRAGAPADSDTDPGSIARTGARDTDDNAADFRFTASPTPGR